MKMMTKTALKAKTNSLFRAAQNGNHAHSRSTCALIKVWASNRLIMSNLTHLNESHHRRVIDMSKFKMPSLIRFFWGSGISEMFEISDERIKQSIEMIDLDLTIDVSANFRPLSTGAWFAIFFRTNITEWKSLKSFQRKTRKMFEKQYALYLESSLSEKFWFTKSFPGILKVREEIIWTPNWKASN